MSTAMWVIVGIVLLLLLLLIGVVVYVLVTDDSEVEAVARAAAAAEPRVWRVLEERAGASSLDVLFLGDGFVTDAQLDAYRSAVYQLATGLIERPPFDRYADKIDFFRIDVRDESDQFPDSTCADWCPELKTLDIEPSLAPPPTGSEARFGSDTVELDLGATRCWSSSGTGSACYVFWTDDPGKEAAFHLAESMFPDIDVEVVVVVVNAQETAGAGLYDVSMDVDRLVFVAVDLESAAGASESWVTTQAHLLFAHEMGHALGLLDEYTLSTGTPREPSYKANIWVPAGTASESNGAFLFQDESTQVLEDPPWSELLPADCDAASMVPCCGGPSTEPNCPVCAGVSEIGCHVVPAVCQDPYEFCYQEVTTECRPQISCAAEGFDPLWLCAPGDCDGPVGAWEGAVYSRTGYYRAERNCRMRKLDKNVGFCEACVLYLQTEHFN